jgi:hypothetical protein
VRETESQDLPKLESFGAVLRYYREHIADRLRPHVPGRLPPVQLSARDVVNSMKDFGVDVSTAAYADIEQGLYLPKDPDFLDAAAASLAIEKGSRDYQNLMDHLVADLLKSKVGDERAQRYVDDLREARRVQHAAQVEQGAANHLEHES